MSGRGPAVQFEELEKDTKPGEDGKMEVGAETDVRGESSRTCVNWKVSSVLMRQASTCFNKVGRRSWRRSNKEEMFCDQNVTRCRRCRTTLHEARQTEQVR